MQLTRGSNGNVRVALHTHKSSGASDKLRKIDVAHRKIGSTCMYAACTNFSTDTRIIFLRKNKTRVYEIQIDSFRGQIIANGDLSKLQNTFLNVDIEAKTSMLHWSVAGRAFPASKVVSYYRHEHRRPFRNISHRFS